MNSRYRKNINPKGGDRPHIDKRRLEKIGEIREDRKWRGCVIFRKKIGRMDNAQYFNYNTQELMPEMRAKS